MPLTAQPILSFDLGSSYDAAVGVGTLTPYGDPVRDEDGLHCVDEGQGASITASALIKRAAPFSYVVLCDIIGPPGPVSGGGGHQSAFFLTITANWPVTYFSWGASMGPSVAPNIFGSDTVEGGYSATGSLPDWGPRLFHGVFAGGSHTLYHSPAGVSVASAAAGTAPVYTGTSTLMLGAAPGSTDIPNVVYQAIALFDYALSEADRTAIAANPLILFDAGGGGEEDAALLGGIFHTTMRRRRGA